MCFGVFVQVNEGSRYAGHWPIGYIIQENGCWEWVGAYRRGYGEWRMGTRRVGAHREMYERKNGPVPKELHLDHLCRNPSCVNPDHLEAVTPKVNILRGVGGGAKNAKKTTCKRGHPFQGANLSVWRGQRVCLECRRLNDRRRYHSRSDEKRLRKNAYMRVLQKRLRAEATARRLNAAGWPPPRKPQSP